MPVYINTLAPVRHGQGYESNTARLIRLKHEALSVVFNNWEVLTRESVQLYWGGKTLHTSKLYLAAVIVDHPQLDNFAGSGKNTLLYVIIRDNTLWRRTRGCYCCAMVSVLPNLPGSRCRISVKKHSQGQEDCAGCSSRDTRSRQSGGKFSQRWSSALPGAKSLPLW